MVESSRRIVSSVLRKNEAEVVSEWIKLLVASTGRRPDLIGEAELRTQATQLVRLLAETAAGADPTRLDSPDWSPVRNFLAELSRNRATQGFNTAETATFVFSLKQPLFTLLRRELEGDPAALADAYWDTTLLLDRLGLFTTEVHQRAREEVIERQRRDMLELSTPVVQIWKGVLALPLIGTLDSTRTQQVMENLLQRIVDTGSEIAIVDITGVPTVDTLTAQHLIKTVTATRLMGADCIISGVRPQIAQTLVHLGVNMGHITTKTTLAAALAVALERTGAVGRAEGR